MGSYFVLASAYIVLSDLALASRSGGTPEHMMGDMLKGLLFVAFTSIMLWVVLQRQAVQRREAEERWRILFHQSQAILVLIEPDSHRISDVSQGAQAFYGDHIVGKSVGEVASVEPKVLEEHLALFRNGQEATFRSQHRRGDGSIADVSVRVSPALHDGRIVHSVHVQDLTAQVLAEKQSSLLSSVVDQTRNPVYALDPQTHEIVFINAAGRAYLTPETPLVFHASAVEENYKPEFIEKLLQLAPHEQPYVWETTLRLSSGRKLPVEMSASHIVHDGKTLLAGYISDISERRERTRRLQLQALALESAANAVVVCDQEGKIEYVNAAFESMTGYSKAEILGQFPRILTSTQYDDAYFEKLWQIVSSGQVFRSEMTNRRKNGELYQANLSITPMLGKNGNTLHYIGIQEDVTQRRQAETLLEYQSNFDALTGLPNRVNLLRRLDRELRQQPAEEVETELRSVPLILVDMDDFRKINEVLGYDVGDEVLKAVVARLHSLLRASDFMARLDGDKFAILISGEVSHPIDPAGVALRICEAMRAPFNIEEREVFVTASVGIALGPQDGTASEPLLQAAGLALEQSKSRGKNLFQYFSPALQDLALKRLQTLDEIRRAITRQEFCLFYQPKLLLEDLSVVGFEALIRWNHPERGVLGPYAFIEAAEESGLIVEIGTWVLDEACRQIQEWNRAGIEVGHVAVNLSVLQFTRSKLPELVKQSIEKWGIKPEQLELEITESLLALEQQLILPQMQKIAELGVPFSIDDFGTGYSSLAYLQSFPVTTLKIAQQFVLPAVREARPAAIVHTVLSMAKALDMRVVAEGIETEEHLLLLRDMGCPHGQGYYFARPMPAKDVPTYLQSQSPQASASAR